MSSRQIYSDHRVHCVHIVYFIYVDHFAYQDFVHLKRNEKQKKHKKLHNIKTKAQNQTIYRYLFLSQKTNVISI